MEKLEIRAVIKFFYKKGTPLKEIHEDFMETLGKESPSYNTVKKWAERSGHPKDATTDENVKVVYTLYGYV